MAYDKQELEEKAIKAIEENELVFIEDVISFMPCGRSTFYNYELDELEDIKERLEKNKINLKRTLRNKWLMSDSPVLQIALYKLLGSDEERKKLSNNRQSPDAIEYDREMPLFLDIGGEADFNSFSTRTREEIEDRLLNSHNQ